MTFSTAHLDDENLSALLDEQLSAAEAAAARAHLAACEACTARLADLRAVVTLLRALPSVASPRPLTLGPRLVRAGDADPDPVPANVVRLRRWYTASRALASTLAATFVLLLAGTLYVDAQSGSPAPAELAATSSRAGSAAVSAPQAPQAPAAANAGAPAAAKVAAEAGAPVRQAAPAPGAPAPPAADAAVERRAPAAAATGDPGTSDQVVAATSVRPLPTPLPTPTIGAFASAASVLREVAEPPARNDPAAPWRIGALLAGVLCLVATMAAITVRRRLRAPHPES